VGSNCAGRLEGEGRRIHGDGASLPRVPKISAGSRLRRDLQASSSFISAGKERAYRQVGFNGVCYLFDLLAVNPFDLGLGKLLEDGSVIKIFHDFCEDSSALVNQFNVHCVRVFDTQVAHRHLAPSGDQKDQNVSLNLALKTYLGIENTQKQFICSEMDANPGLWWQVSPLLLPQRPLSPEMLSYAGMDALYLPLVYSKMQAMLDENKFLKNAYAPSYSGCENPPSSDSEFEDQKSSSTASSASCQQGLTKKAPRSDSFQEF